MGKHIAMMIICTIGCISAVFPATAQVADDWSLTWDYVGEEIEFVMTAPTTGWVSVGFNPSRGMKDAEFVLAYVDDGKVVARQDFGTGRFSHSPVTGLGWTETLRIVSGTEANGVTTVVFRLPVLWGEAYGVRFESGQTYKVLLAYGPDRKDNFTSKHRKHKTLTLNF